MDLSLGERDWTGQRPTPQRSSTLTCSDCRQQRSGVERTAEKPPATGEDCRFFDTSYLHSPAFRQSFYALLLLAFLSDRSVEDAGTFNTALGRLESRNSTKVRTRRGTNRSWGYSKL